ncbi:MAG: carbohydrate ABC transporter permease [Chloroflexota bacterium]
MNVRKMTGKGYPINFKSLTRYGMGLILLAYTLITSFPFFWTAAISLRRSNEVLMAPYGLPNPPYFQNYVHIFTNPTLHYSRFILNSAFVTTAALVLTTIVTTMAAFAFARARYKYPMRDGLYALIFLSLMFPPQVTLLATFQLLVQYKLYNTLLGLILVYSAMALPFNIYILRAFFRQIPQELEDAALIDGCTDRQIFWKVMFPIARPAIAATVVLNFISFWNEFLYAVTYITKPELRTLPLAVMFFIGEAYLDYGMLAASLVVTMLPVIILYLILSELFVEGMTAGAVKG